MSQDQSSSNNIAAPDDVSYVFYRGVRTAVRNPTLQAQPKETHTTPSYDKESDDKASETVSSQNASAPVMQIKKVSPSAAKPWLDDSVILSAKPQNEPFLKPTTITPKASTQLTAPVTIANIPTGEDTLIPASVSTSEAAKAAPQDAKAEEPEASFEQQTPLRQRPQLQLPQLRPNIQLPPLFAAAEVVKTDNESAALSPLTAARLSMPLRKTATSAPADNTSTQANAQSVTNEMLLQEIAQLRANMSEMQRTLQEIQAQLQKTKTSSTTGT